MKEREEENLRERLLLEAAGRGEREAFARLLEGCQSRFLVLLLRMGIERSEAEHLLLEAFWKVWKGAPRFRGECLASTWITRIVLNTALKALAKKNPIDWKGELLEERWEDHSPGPAETLERKERTLLVQEALDTLPPRGRVVLILKHSEGLSYSEIAQVMETTPSAVESLLSRSRKQLFERLKTLQETTKGFPVSGV